MISTERTLLTFLAPTDFDELLEMFADDRMFDYIQPHQGKDRDWRLDFLHLKQKQIETKTGFYWVIREKSTGRFIGAINVTPIPKTNKMQIGWMITQAFQRKGLAMETAQATMGFILYETHINPLYGVYDVRNTASDKILSRLGFQFHRSFPEGNDTIIEVVYHRPSSHFLV